MWIILRMLVLMRCVSAVLLYFINIFQVVQLTSCIEKTNKSVCNDSYSDSKSSSESSSESSFDDDFEFVSGVNTKVSSYQLML